MQTGDGRPSYDELAALVVQQAQMIVELPERVAALEAENAELKRRLGMDSTNSSKCVSATACAPRARDGVPTEAAVDSARTPGQASAARGAHL